MSHTGDCKARNPNGQWQRQLGQKLSLGAKKGNQGKCDHRAYCPLHRVTHTVKLRASIGYGSGEAQRHGGNESESA